jgi:hypothetical protein
MFSLQQNQRRKGWNRFCLKVGWAREVAQTMCTHVSKCKNDKIFKEGDVGRKERKCFVLLTSQVEFCITPLAQSSTVLQGSFKF